MNYREFCLEVLKNDIDLQKIKDELEIIKGKNVLIFSHDDPNGLTSACIM